MSWTWTSSMCSRFCFTYHYYVAAGASAGRAQRPSIIYIDIVSLLLFQKLHNFLNRKCSPRCSSSCFIAGAMDNMASTQKIENDKVSSRSDDKRTYTAGLGLCLVLELLVCSTAESNAAPLKNRCQNCTQANRDATTKK